MLKSPVNIVPLFSGDTLISELQRSSLKFVGRNFDVDGDRYHTLRKLCVREVYFKPNTFQFINFQISPTFLNLGLYGRMYVPSEQQYSL